MKEYYVICKRHAFRQDYAILFWGPDNKGYTYNVNVAGVYGEEVLERFRDHESDDCPVEKSIIDSMVKDSVIDNKVLGKIVLNNPQNRRVLKISTKELHAGPSNWDYRAFCSPKQFLIQNQDTIELINQVKEQTKV